MITRDEEDINSEAILSIISNFSLFCELNKKEFETVAQYLKILHPKKGELIFHEGDAGKDMYIHFSGTLNAFIVQSDGTERSLFNIYQGDFFGEMSIITNEPRSVSISVTEDATIIKISGKDFYKIIREHPNIGFKILHSISLVQNNWLDQTSKSFSDLIRWGETARRRAVTDEMTGLYNRRFLEETIKEYFSNQSMNFRIMSLLMMDLDRIHGINDKYGTKAGDLIIIAAADEIRSCLRNGDIPARLSGDEFAILLPDTDKEDALKIAELIRKKIEERQVEIPESPGSAETIMIGTKTSIGIAAAPAHANSMETLEEASDTALRKAKDLGRNRVEIFS